jgi:DNA-binding GntR family transcriptional regulator
VSDPAGTGRVLQALQGRSPIHTRPQSLAQYVRSLLRDDILAGRLEPGRVLTESEVSTYSGVSRTPCREGMRLLEAEGLIVHPQGRPAVVAPPPSPEETEVIYQCRVIVEGTLTELAAGRMTDDQIGILKEILRQFRHAASIGEPPVSLAEIDRTLHAFVCEAAGNRLVTIFRSYWAQFLTALSTRVYGRVSPLVFADEHARIVEALGRRDGPAARQAMIEHILHGKQVLEEIQKLDADRSGSPSGAAPRSAEELATASVQAARAFRATKSPGRWTNRGLPQARER